MKTYSFPETQRLKTNEQFRRVFKNRTRRSDDLLIVYCSPNGLDFARIGISIGKACGNAVSRNRVKRLIRESFRLNPDRFPVGFDYVVVVNPKIKDNLEQPAKKLKLKDIENSLIGLVRRLNG